MDVTSRHLRSATELQLLVPIRNGFVENTERLTSYATRLKLLLEALTEPTRVAWERDCLLPTTPIDTLQSIYSTQWAVREHPESSQLLVSSSFDRSWEEYFHLLVDRTGPLLDAIFMHCKDYDGQTCVDGYELFAKFIRSNQLQNSFFYMSAPDLTVDDLRRARNMLGGGLATQAPLGTLQEDAIDVYKRRVASDASFQKRQEKSLKHAVSQLLLLRTLFPATERFGATSAPRSAEQIFDAAVASLLELPLASPQAIDYGPQEKLWLAGLKAINSARHQEQATRLTNRLQPIELKHADLQDIQGSILEPYATRPASVSHGCVILIQCDDATAAQDLLKNLEPKVSRATIASKQAQPEQGCLNVALTYNGLRRLGLPEPILAELPKEFREGMEARAGLVGDVGFPNAPEFWQQPLINWPPLDKGASAQGAERVSLSSVDVVVLYQRQLNVLGDQDHTWSTAHPLYKDVTELWLDGNGCHILHVQPLQRGKEGHFKLPDKNASQPIPSAVLHDANDAARDLTLGQPARDLVPLGELLLGYPDNRGETALIAQRHGNLFKNGSFLVVRKLVQDVAAFEAYLDKSAIGASAATGAIIGRDAGTSEPLGRKAQPPITNDFDFDGDADGKLCPLHSHIRRTNPRPPAAAAVTGSDLIPRIMRRSFPYGPSAAGPAVERGLLFMAYNASIASQFEVVQRWVNGGNSTGLPSTQNDLLSGVPQPNGATHAVFHQDKWTAMEPLQNPLVTLQWGMYLFVPSAAGMRSLASPDALTQRAVLSDGAVTPEQDARDRDPGQELIATLNNLEPAQAQIAWKQLVEGAPSPQSELVWQTIRAANRPVFAKNYALLVGTESGARDVLSDSGERFSVREYYQRLGETIGTGFDPSGPESTPKSVHYLAYDPVQAGPVDSAPVDGRHKAFLDTVKSGEYWELSGAPNSFIGSLARRTTLHAEAHDLALEILGKHGTPEVPVLLPALFRQVTAKLADTLIGIPGQNDAEKLALLEHFIVISRYSFQPYPDDKLAQAARASGHELRKQYASYKGPMQEALNAKNGGDFALVAMGAIVGFSAPFLGCVTNVVCDLLQSGELQRLQVSLARASAAHMEQMCQAIVKRVLARVPVPPILYRTAVGHGKTSLLSDVAQYDVTPGQLVVLGLGSASQSGTEGAAWVFGGPHGASPNSGQPHHGCPARDPALRMMSGLLELFLRLPNVRASGGLHFLWDGGLPAPLSTGSAAAGAAQSIFRR